MGRKNFPGKHTAWVLLIALCPHYMWSIHSSRAPWAWRRWNSLTHEVSHLASCLCRDNQRRTDPSFHASPCTWTKRQDPSPSCLCSADEEEEIKGRSSFIASSHLTLIQAGQQPGRRSSCAQAAVTTPASMLTIYDKFGNLPASSLSDQRPRCDGKPGP